MDTDFTTNGNTSIHFLAPAGREQGKKPNQGTNTALSTLPSSAIIAPSLNSASGKRWVISLSTGSRLDATSFTASR